MAVEPRSLPFDLPSEADAPRGDVPSAARASTARLRGQLVQAREQARRELTAMHADAQACRKRAQRSLFLGLLLAGAASLLVGWQWARGERGLALGLGLLGLLVLGVGCGVSLSLRRRARLVEARLFEAREKWYWTLADAGKKLADQAKKNGEA